MYRLLSYKYENSFIDIWHSITTDRFKLQQKFQSSLSQREFCGRKQFYLYKDTILIQYILDTIDDSHLFLTQYEHLGSKVFVRQGPENIEASLASSADIWELQLPNIDMLKPVLGENYWWAATGEQFGFGSLNQRQHNYIKPIDADISLKFDRISKKLTVSYSCICGNHIGAVNDLDVDFNHQQKRLLNKLIIRQQEEYRIISIEMNSTKFFQPHLNRTKKARATTTMVAWLIKEGTRI